ncbi:hypothetical protein [Halothiobacillus sp.]|uniref:hypothetical protein n=1 Tax=Halothiobacillus sp. TaxID=1891311 RepID=UPI002613FDFD|nr:hypothetical protein [Halothiobacillus sp.]
MKNASTLSNQDVSMAANENHNKTRAELLNDLRRQIDWLMGAYCVLLDDPKAEKQGGSR